MFDKANFPYVTRFLDMYIENHGVSRTIRLDQAKYQNHIHIIDAELQLMTIEHLAW